jgi:hypothetical protein
VVSNEISAGHLPTKETSATVGVNPSQGFRPSQEPFPASMSGSAWALTSGSAEGVELMRVLLLNLAPPFVRAALRLSDRSVTGLKGRRPCARYARPRPGTPQ